MADLRHCEICVKPSDHYQAGECGFCHATGLVTFMVPPPEHIEPCPACGGSGKWPPDQPALFDAS